MTSVTGRRAAPAWRLVVRGALHAAEAETGPPQGPHGDAGVDARELADAEAAVARLGAAMEEASASVGLEVALGWTLLDLRDVLASHLIAARAVAEVGVDEDAARELLRRGVDEVAAALAPLLAPMTRRRRSAAASG